MRRLSRIRRMILLLFLACCFLLSGMPGKAGEEEKPLTAWDVVNDITVGWNLGNDLDCYDGTGFGLSDLSTENLWGNPAASKELLASVKASGINAVRLPVTWYNHMDPETHRIDPLWMARVREVVDAILAEYMQILYDRIPTLPQSLTLRDFGIIRHLWHNIAVRLAESER